MKKILLVDDNKEWLETMVTFFTDNGFDVFQASSGEEAIQIIDEKSIDLIISDLLMPGVDGFELCHYVRDSESIADIPFIFCSGFFPEVQQKELSELLHVEDFFTKPVPFDLLLEAVNKNLKVTSVVSTDSEKKEGFSSAHRELIQSNLWAAVDREKEQRAVAEALAEKLQENLEGFIYTVSKAIEARDPYTAGHQKRVAMLAIAIGKVLGFNEEQLTGLKFGAMIHDIGKIHLPAEILSKPARLSELEFEMVKTHTTVGYNILNDVDFPWPIADIAYQHHERVDGSGYPKGLHGDDMIVEAKIVAVADVAEAMMSHRPYRASLGKEVALAELEKNKGTHFDADIVDVCQQVFKTFSFEEAEVDWLT